MFYIVGRELGINWHNAETSTRLEQNQQGRQHMYEGEERQGSDRGKICPS